MVGYVGVLTATCQVATEKQFMRPHPLVSGYRPNFVFASEYCPGEVEVLGEDIAPGEVGQIRVRLIVSDKSAQALRPGVAFELREAQYVIAWCTVNAVEELKRLEQ